MLEAFGIVPVLCGRAGLIANTCSRCRRSRAQDAGRANGARGGDQRAYRPDDSPAAVAAPRPAVSAAPHFARDPRRSPRCAHRARDDAPDHACATLAAARKGRHGSPLAQERRRTPDRSRAIASWVSEAIYTGFNDDSIKRLLRDPAHGSAKKSASATKGEGEKWLDLTISEERDWLDDNPRVQIDAVLDRIEARAFDSPEHWRGRGGASAFAVLIFFLMIARKARSLDFGAARREAMLWTGIADPKRSSARPETGRVSIHPSITP